MLLKWKVVESLEKPVEVDCTLSTTDVYYRKDIQEVKTETGIKYVYQETVLSEEFRFNILDVQEYIKAIKDKIEKINAELHITKLDFYTQFCQPVGITYEELIDKVKQVGMIAQWELCNHVYYGIIKPFLSTLPLQKTEEEIIAIFEQYTNG